MRTIDSLPRPAPRDERAEVIEHVPVAPNHYRIRVHAPFVAEHAAPGQFVQLRVSSTNDPFLRRPLSVGLADADEGWIELVYHVVGEGTRALSERRIGERIAVLGPLGHPFRLPSDALTVLAGGGVGMPPLHFAAHRLPAERTLVVQGARTAALLLYEAEFARLNVRTYTATEDGTAGIRGLITDVLVSALNASRAPVEVMSCGPTPMMVAVAAIARQRGLPCQVSLEERMACGFGICMGCAVRRTGKPGSPPAYSLVCLDGPVFDADDVFPPAHDEDR